jgi:tetratricopeptide (TPR) repeat protein
MAKRVNTRFLVVLTAVFALLIAAAVLAKVTVFRKDPKANEAAGDNAVKEGQYKKAIEYYRYAIAASKNSNDLLVKAGDTFNLMVADDPQNLFNARAMWNQALANDPKFEPALQRLLDSYWEQMELMPLEGEIYVRVRETAQRLSDVRPGDVKVKSRVYIATLRPWLEGIPGRKEEIAESVKALYQLMDRAPADADIRFYYAQARLKDAREKRERGEHTDADVLSAQAAGVFDAALRDPPKDPAANAAMNLRAYQVYSRLDQIQKALAAEAERMGSRDVITFDTSAGSDKDKAAAAKAGNYAAKADKAIAAAVEAARSLPPDGNLYFEVQAQAADAVMKQKRVAEAEKIFEDLLAKRPEDQKARIVYARLLATTPDKREKAIEVLNREVKVGRLIGPRGFEASQLRLQTLIERVGIKIDLARALAAAPLAPTQEASAAAAAKQRQDLVAQIREDVQALGPMVSGESVALLRLKARLLQLEGKQADAIQTYQRAVNLMEGSSAERKDYDLINELAIAYLQAGQTGSAKKLLEQIVARYDAYVPAKLQLAQLLVNENKLEDAKLQMREAEKQLLKMPGDSPEYARVRAEFDRTGLTIMKLEKNPRLEESFTRLPEASRAEKLQKAQVARQIGRNEDAVRLAQAAVKDDPADMLALETLLQALLATNRRPEALAAIEAAIAVNPDKVARLNPVREGLKASVELAKATPQQIYERRKQILEAEPESLGKSLRLADLEREFNHPDQAEQILLALHEKNANEVQVTSRLFELNVALKKWEKARGYLDKLVAANADEAGGLLFRFRFAMSRGDTAEGLRIAKSLVGPGGKPEFDVSWVAYGQALQADRRYAEAIKQYETARQKKALNTDALRGIVECYLAQNQPGKAREALTEARVLFPNDPVFRDMDIQFQLDYGNPGEAVGQLEQLQRERPDQPDAWIKLGMAYRAAAKLRPDTDAAGRAELQAKARDLLQKGAARWEGDERYVERFVRQQAALALESGDVAAGETIVKAYAARPDRQDRAEAQLVLADFYSSANKPDEARAAYEAAIKKLTDKSAAAGGKDDPAAAMALQARLDLSALLAQQRKYDEALKVLDGAPVAASAAVDRRLFNQRLTILLASDRRADAEKLLLDTMAKSTQAANDTGLQMMLVRVNYDGGRYDEALDRVTKVLKNDPENLEARFYRGQILLRRPQPDLAAAVNELTEVRKLAPNHPPTRVLLADAYRLQGDMPKALRELQEGLRIDATSRELRLRLMDVRSDESMGAQDLNEVLRLAREARANPTLKNDPVWAWREARVYALRREWPKAIVAIEDAVKLSPQDPGLLREYQSIQIQAEAFKPVLDQTDKLVKEGRAPWWVFMNRAAAKSGLKDQPGAIAEFNLALTAAGQDNAAVEQIVKTMTTTVGKDRAVEQVMARTGKDVRWKLLAAALHSVYKEWDKATAMLDDVQAHFNELDPKQQAQALRIAGPLYQLARPPQLDKARASYEKLLKLEPNDLFALNNLATLLIDDALVPQPEEARVHSKKAYDLVKRAQPFPAAIFDTHGWVLVQSSKREDIDEGISILQKVTRQTSMPEAHYHLGEAYIKKQDGKRALEELKVAAQSINNAPGRGIAVTPDLEKKIQSATEKAKELVRSQTGGEAVAN